MKGNAVRRLLVVMLAAGAALGTGTAVASPSSGPDMTAQANLCGSSYTRIDTYQIRRDSITYGRVELYWSATTKRNCALTIGSGATEDWRGFKSVSVCPSGNSDGSLCGDDAGEFRFYAGPAYTKSGYNMSGKCVDVVGIIEHPNGKTADGGGLGVHCG